MNPIIHSYVIDLQNKYNRIRQYEIKQFDTDSHKFAFTLLDNSVAYNLTGLTGKIYIKKPDGTEVFSNLTIDNATGGKLSFLLTTQCLTVPGAVEAEITLYGTSGEVLTSITFTYIVKHLLRGDESIESTNEYTALTESLALVETWNQQFETKYNGLEAEYATDLTEVKDGLEELSKNENNPFSLGLDGQSSSDVSTLMQQFLDFSTSSGIKKVNFPYGTYIVSTPLYVNSDDVEVDFQGSTIKWRGTANLNNSNLRAIGVINGHGTLGSNATVTEFVPKEELFNVSIDSDSFVSSILACKVKTNNNSLFAIGDFVNLDLSTGTNTISTLLPMVGIICEILDITSDGYIVLDYYSPFDWSGKTITGTLTKVTPRKNVKVKNLRIEDEVVVNATYKTDGQRETFVSGVSFLYDKGCDTKNISGKNTKFPLVIHRYSHTSQNNKLEVKKPAIFDGGEGYSIQFIFCNKCTADSSNPVRERHSVDISGGAFFEISNCHSPRPKFMPFDMHGLCEHSITFRNCTGAVIMCNGISDFPCLVDNVKFINHKGAITCGGTDSYASNIIIEDSEVTLLNYHALNTTTQNSNVTINTSSSNYDLFPNKRGSSSVSSMSFIGGNVDIYGTGGVTVLKNYYDIVTFDCTVNNKLNLSAGVRSVLSFIDNTTVNIKKCIFNDIDRFIFTKNYTSFLFLNIKENQYNYTSDKSSRNLVEFATMTGSTVFLDFDNNKSNYTYSNFLTLILLQESSGNFGSANFYISGKGNIFIGSSANLIRMFLTAPSGGQTYTLNHTFLSNIFKNYQGTTIDSTYNKLI